MPSPIQQLLQSNIGRHKKLLLLLADSRGEPLTPARMRLKSSNMGFNIPKGWNVSSILSRTNGLAVRSKVGWEISDSGIHHLEVSGLLSNQVHSSGQVRDDLRALIKQIAAPETRAFVQEAVQAFETGLHRSAVVMSWLGAIDILYEQVASNYLSAFNAEACKVDKRWKPATTKDDLSRMKEFDFLNRIAAISLIGKNVKTELEGCLKRRNACGHPNSYRLGTNVVAHHIETLTLNVFEPHSNMSP